MVKKYIHKCLQKHGNIFGKLFVCFMTLFLVGAYTVNILCVLPFDYISTNFFILKQTINHWLFINIVFHYYKTAFTSPGHPQSQVLKDLPEIHDLTTLMINTKRKLISAEDEERCFKCYGPKPERTHHCSVCRKCILKMDHHCMFLDNCIGFYNHRHFFLLSAFSAIGCLYGAFALHETFGTIEIVSEAPLDQFCYYILQDGITTFLVLAVAAIIILIWQGITIHNGETILEQRLRLLYPSYFPKKYDLGPKENWKIFLGLTNGRTFWRHILLPSTHKPEGDGIMWTGQNDVPERITVV